MENKVKKTKIIRQITKDIEKKPWEFSFHQMLFILELLSKNKSEFGTGKNPEKEPGILEAYSSFSVPISDCIEVKKAENGYKITVNQTSLIGINGILPQTYTEKIIQKKLENNEAPADFLNIFHQRIFGLKHKIEKKNQPSLNKNPLNNFNFHHKIGGINIAKNDWQNCLSSQPYFLWNKTKNSAGLKSILSSIFPFQFQIDEFLPKWLEISEEARCFLDKQSMKNKLLGQRANCMYKKIKITIKLANEADFNNFIPGTPDYELMKKISKYYVQSGTEIVYKIDLDSSKKTQIQLKNSQKLGYNTWLTKNKKT